MSAHQARTLLLLGTAVAVAVGVAFSVPLPPRAHFPRPDPFVSAPTQLAPATAVPAPVPPAVDKPGTEQDRDDDPPAEEKPRPAVTLPKENLVQRKFDAVADYRKQESWSEVAEMLQALLDLPEDVFVSVRSRSAGGEEVEHWVGARARAERLLAALPEKGRQFYELHQGAAARNLLAEAKAGDEQALADLARRYLHTEAGAEAARMMAARHLDRGRCLLASLWYRRLLATPQAERLPPGVLLQAALAFAGAGDEAGTRDAWRRLAERAPGGVRVAGQRLGLDDLKPLLGRYRDEAGEGDPLAPWRTFRGAADRAARCDGQPPDLEPKWDLSTTPGGSSRSWVRQALAQGDRAAPPLPSAFPLPAGNRLVFRSYDGLHAVDLATGETAWESRAERGLESMARDGTVGPYLSAWINGYAREQPTVLFENSVVGTLSGDGVRVYAVDDLPVPPYFAQSLPGAPAGWPPVASRRHYTELPEELNHVMNSNQLLAFDAVSGKLLWKLGGHEEQPRGRALKDSYFLGPPLPLAGKLYAVVEKHQELRLACLDGARGDVDWIQTLVTSREKLLWDVRRRLHAAHVAHGDGLLVCATNAGAVVAVDLLTGGLAWAHVYRPDSPPQVVNYEPWGWRGRMPSPVSVNLRSEWQTSAPAVHDGKVVFTSPDEASVHCVRLRDGAPLWKEPRQNGDLFFAGVHDGKALVVGAGSCRALGAGDGKQLWKVTTGRPSGQGVFAGGLYFLPLHACADGKGPGVYGIDMARGAVTSRAESPNKEAPGNLIFHQGHVLSQTTTGVTAFAQGR